MLRAREILSLNGLMFVGTCLGFVASSVLPVASQSVDLVQAEAVATEELVFPGFRAGGWRKRTQLVWDGTVTKLARRTYDIWDPLAEQSLELFWEPDDATKDRAGRIEGKGKLVWRRKGAASYDRDALVAHYRGEMMGGRSHGQGEFLHRSGASYRGEWKDGLMSGQGRLLLPNGDEYVGGFAAGRRSGMGVYIDRVGTVYKGSFLYGQRDGAGVIIPVRGASFRAFWIGDREVAGSRAAVPGRSGADRLRLAQYRDYDDVRLGISVDRRPIIEAPDVMPLHYISESTPDGLAIFPDDQHLLDVWRGVAPIQVVDVEYMNDDSREESFLGPRIRFRPVPILFDLENLSAEPVRIVSGYLDVIDSVSDLEPAVQLVDPPVLQCGGTEVEPSFSLENFGWSDPQGAQLKGSFVTEDGRPIGTPFQFNLGTFNTSAVDMRDKLVAEGVDIGKLETSVVPCSQKTGGERCLAEARASGVFGQLADAVTMSGVFFFAVSGGTLEYDWTDSVGTTHHKISAFQSSLLLGNIAYQAECGEGGEEETPFKDPFVFQLDSASYRIPVPIANDVAPGVTTRWRMELEAPKSSTHSFRLVLQLADGRQVASRPIDLLYFVPKQMEEIVSEDDASGPLEEKPE